jgi:hypothetical protein
MLKRKQIAFDGWSLIKPIHRLIVSLMNETNWGNLIYLTVSFVSLWSKYFTLLLEFT